MNVIDYLLKLIESLQTKAVNWLNAAQIKILIGNVSENLETLFRGKYTKKREYSIL